jgi:hypothetical protein
MELTTKYKFKRRLKWVYVKFRRIFKIGNKNEKTKRPKNLNESQNMAVDITVKTILNPNSVLNYDPETHECYIQHDSIGGDLYIFIEARNIKIINTVFGYDIPISIPVENYVTSVFKREVTKRRLKFKKGSC